MKILMLTLMMRRRRCLNKHEMGFFCLMLLYDTYLFCFRNGILHDTAFHRLGDIFIATRHSKTRHSQVLKGIESSIPHTSTHSHDNQCNLNRII